MSRIRVLFLPDVEYDNINAQSLNVREIALRLDPETFDIALWYEREPDPRLVHRPGVRLLQLPPRHKTVRILREMVAGYDLIAYTDISPASYLFLHLPHSVRGRAKTVFHAEAPLAQIGFTSKCTVSSATELPRIAMHTPRSVSSWRAT